MTTPARLHPADLDALADLVAARIIGRLADASSPLSRGAGEGTGPAAPVEAVSVAADAVPALLTAAQVADRFGVSVEWVREHAGDLGVIRLGKGPRPRLRFEAEKVAAALTPRLGNGESDTPVDPAPLPNRRSSGAEGTGSALDSLPVRELQPRRSTSTKAAGRRWRAPGPAPRDVSSAQHEPIRDGSALAGRVRAPRQEA